MKPFLLLLAGGLVAMACVRWVRIAREVWPSEPVTVYSITADGKVVSKEKAPVETRA